MVDYSKEAQKQWEADPTYAENGRTLTYEEIRKERYKDMPWLPEVLDFKSFKNKRLLEVGFGRGIELMEFAKAGAEVWGIDMSWKHFQFVQADLKKNRLQANIRISDITEEELPSGHFNAVYSCGVLHHVKEVDLALANIYRMMKADGEFMSLVYNRNSIAYWFSFLICSHILSGRFLRMGLKDSRAYIEWHSKGNNAKTWVDVYTPEEWKAKLEKAGFRDVQITIRHLTKKDFAMFRHLIPNWLFRKLDERKWGWHIIAKCRK